MLKANIMVQCIDGLLRESDDESLECLCALFSTIGEQIETEAQKNEKQHTILNNFFVKMEKIAEQKEPLVKGTSARVRFMLRDIIDMRSNGWKQAKLSVSTDYPDVKLHSTTSNGTELVIKSKQQNKSSKVKTLTIGNQIGIILEYWNLQILTNFMSYECEDVFKQIFGLNINTEERLKIVIKVVFKKAIEKPAFYIQYANLCKRLSNGFKVMTIKSDSNSKEVNFDKLFIVNYQNQFQTKESRKQILINIKLIGELYKLSMLNTNFMVQYMYCLLKESDDNSVDRLCALLRRIGEQIESEAKKVTKEFAILNNFFIKMEKFVEEKDRLLKEMKWTGMSTRVILMLKDIIDMRSNNWKSGRDQNLIEF